MFKRKTLFIVGAGASAEVDFPVGTQLAQQIGAKMDIRFERGFDPIGTGDHDLYSHIVHARRQDADQLQNAAWRIRDGIPFAQSIDDFLDQHRNDAYVNLYGKVAIVQAIVEAERASKLYFNPLEGAETFDADKLADTWFVKFMYMLSRGVPRERIAHIFENVSFVVFNYDRCIEHFLIHALKRAYSIRHEDAAAIVGNLHIIHPYGDVGDLRKVPFGATRINCVALSERIKTYTEQAAVAEVTSAIQEEIEQAECVVFLGFAYHSQNIQMIRVSKRSDKVIYGTAFGMSEADVSVVTGLIDRALSSPGPFHIENKLKCAELFNFYARSLTGGD
jgi:hypothetical protein